MVMDHIESARQTLEELMMTARSRAKTASELG